MMAKLLESSRDRVAEKSGGMQHSTTAGAEGRDAVSSPLSDFSETVEAVAGRESVLPR